MDYHIPIFLNIPLVYFNKSDRMILKRIYAFFISAYMMCITQLCEAWNHAYMPDGFFRIFIQSVNMLVFSSCIGTVAYCFCNKFNEAEEKLRRINDNLERMANLDTLTGLSNRRHMNEQMKGLVHEFNRTFFLFMFFHPFFTHYVACC